MIDPLKYYTVSDLMAMGDEGYFPIKARATILALVNNGKIKAVDTGTKEKQVLHIKGDELLRFLSSYGKLEIH